jgi:hypothetical protein
MIRNFKSKIWPDLLKILISFFLISVIGGGLTYYWQKQSYKFQNRFEQKKYEKEVATKLFEELSRLMDRQICNLQLFIKNQTTLGQCKLDYLQWKENNSRFRALTENYFGKSAANSYLFINDKFNQIFEDLIFNSKTVNTVNLQTFVNELEMDVYKFNSQLIDALLNENIGSSRK